MKKNPLCNFAVVLAVAVGLALSIGTVASQAVEPNLKLNHKDVTNLIANAKTPADHAKIAQYYRQEGRKLERQSKEHEEMSAGYKSNPMYASSKFASSTVDHCAYFVKTKREGAEKMNELAAMHEEMAKDAK